MMWKPKGTLIKVPIVGSDIGSLPVEAAFDQCPIAWGIPHGQSGGSYPLFVLFVERRGQMKLSIPDMSKVDLFSAEARIAVEVADDDPSIPDEVCKALALIALDPQLVEANSDA